MSFHQEVNDVFIERHILLINTMLAFAAEMKPLLHTVNAPQALKLLDLDYANIAAALDRITAHESKHLHDLATELYLKLGPYLELRNLSHDNRRWGWALVTMAEKPDLPPELANLAQAINLPQQVIEGADQDTVRALAEQYNKLGLLQWQSGQATNALASLRQALVLYMKVEHLLGIVGVQLNMSNVCYAAGDQTESLRHAENALLIARQAHDTSLVAQVLPHLANSYMENRQLQEAETALREAVKIFLSEGNEPDAAEVLIQYALLCDSWGRPEDALKLAQQSLTLMERNDLSGIDQLRGWLKDVQRRTPNRSD